MLKKPIALFVIIIIISVVILILLYSCSTWKGKIEMDDKHSVQRSDPSDLDVDKDSRSISPLSPTSPETYKNNDAPITAIQTDMTNTVLITSAEKHSQSVKSNITLKKKDKILPTYRKQLLTHPVYPVTVPPFILDEIYTDLEKQSSNFSCQTDLHTENISESDLKWSKLAHNVGTNTNYFPSKLVPIFDKKQVGIKDNYSMISNNSSKTISSSKFSIDDIFDAAEKEKIRNEILCDLDSDWKGDQRLEKILRFKNSNYNFNNKDEEKKWKEYLPRLFEQVYKSDEQQEQGTEGDATHLKNQDGMRSQLEYETEKWRKYFDQKVVKWKPHISNFIDNSRILPLAFRIIILILSLISLGLSVRIFQNSRNYANETLDSIPQQPSTIMAICVNAIASVYTAYIAHDEFKSAPIGLRNISDKMKLICLDLIFVIFSSANLALAFNTRYDTRWVCSDTYPLNVNGQITKVYPLVPYICRKQKALSAFLFILLFTWILCVIFSMIRIIRRTVPK